MAFYVEAPLSSDTVRVGLRSCVESSNRTCRRGSGKRAALSFALMGLRRAGTVGL